MSHVHDFGTPAYLVISRFPNVGRIASSTGVGSGNISRIMLYFHRVSGSSSIGEHPNKRLKQIPDSALYRIIEKAYYRWVVPILIVKSDNNAIARRKGVNT